MGKYERDRVPSIRVLVKQRTRSHWPMNEQEVRNGVVRYMSQDSDISSPIDDGVPMSLQ